MAAESRVGEHLYYHSGNLHGVFLIRNKHKKKQEEAKRTAHASYLLFKFARKVY